MPKDLFPRGSVAILLIPCIVSYLLSLDWNPTEELLYKTGDFIRKAGYDYEEHTVESTDGFITTMYRIVKVHSNGKPKTKSLPVLMERGLACSSDVMAQNATDLSFILVNEGFDVWLGNYRGTRYTIKGPRVNVSDPLTINYGLEEQSLDYIASIDYILNKTGNNQLDIAVVSAGSPTLIVLQATHPENNRKIRKALHFGPGFTFKLDNWLQRLFLSWPAQFPWFFTWTGILEWSYGRAHIVNTLCTQTFLKSTCIGLVAKLVGLHHDNILPEDAARLIGVFPSGTPVGVIEHLTQLTQGDGEFRKRNWGVEENHRQYNSSIPPLYEVQHISTFTKSYTTSEEVLVNYELSRKIFSRMPNFGGEYPVPPPFHHINFALNGLRNPGFVDDVLRTLLTS